MALSTQEKHDTAEKNLTALQRAKDELGMADGRRMGSDAKGYFAEAKANLQAAIVAQRAEVRTLAKQVKAEQKGAQAS